MEYRLRGKYFFGKYTPPGQGEHDIDAQKGGPRRNAGSRLYTVMPYFRLDLRVSS